MPGSFTPTGAAQTTPTITEGPAQFPLASFQNFVPDPGVTNDDVGSGTITVAGSSTQSLSATDVRSGGLAFTGTVSSESASFSDQIVFNDASAVPVTVSGTFVQSAAHSASRTAAFIVAGTGFDAAAYASVATGQIVVSGTRTENRTHSSSGTASLAVQVVGMAYPGVLLPGKTFAGQAYLPQGVTYTVSRSGVVSLSGFGSDQFVQGGARTFNDQADGTIRAVLPGIAYPGVFIVGITYPGQSWIGDTSNHIGTGTVALVLSGSGPEVIVLNTRFGRPHPHKRRGFDDTKPSRNGFGQPRPRRVRVG